MAMHATYCIVLFMLSVIAVQSLDCECNPPFIFILLTSDHETDTMEPQQKSWRNLLCFLLLCICLKLTVVTGLKKLHRAPKGYNVIDSYYVHIKPQTSWTSVEELVSSLKAMNNDQQKPEFKAEVHSTFTQAGYGFSATLSNATLQMVSYCNAIDHNRNIL